MSEPTREDKIESALEFVADAFALVGVATMLAFLAYSWRKLGAGPTWTGLVLFLVPHFVGRWHAGKSFARDLRAVNALWRAKFEELGRRGRE